MEITLDRVKQKIVDEILAHTTTVLNTLSNIWTPTFDSDTCVSNAEKLVKHVEMLYSEIIEETKYRQEFIKTAIDELHSEASNLKTLLTSNINLIPDIPLYSRQIHLTDCLSSLKAEKETREVKIEMLLEEQKALCTELDEPPRPLNNEPVLPTQEQLIEFRQYLDDLNIERQVRYNEFTKLRHNIDDLLIKLKEYYLANPGDETILNDPNPLTKKNLSTLQNYRENLLSRFNSMREDINKMKIKLEALWNCVELQDDNFKKQFEIIEYDYEIFTKIALELKQPGLLSKIKEKINAARQEISDWWNKTFCSESERAEFLSFTSNSVTEELLTEHETELKRLKDFYSANENMFCLLEKRQQFLHRLAILDENSKDPSRFHNRGGRLLLELREKKIILRKLEDIGLEIIVLADNFTQATSKLFTVNGMSVFELIEEDRKQIRNRSDSNSTRKVTLTFTPKRPAFTPNRNVIVPRGNWLGRRSHFNVTNNVA